MRKLFISLLKVVKGYKRQRKQIEKYKFKNKQL